MMNAAEVVALAKEEARRLALAAHTSPSPAARAVAKAAKEIAKEASREALRANRQEQLDSGKAPRKMVHVEYESETRASVFVITLTAAGRQEWVAGRRRWSTDESDPAVASVTKVASRVWAGKTPRCGLYRALKEAERLAK